MEANKRFDSRLQDSLKGQPYTQRETLSSYSSKPNCYGRIELRKLVAKLNRAIFIS
jgi:hypothetical protein